MGGAGDSGSTSDVLIVGAGLAGLVAARQLGDRGLDVGLLDKGRSVGGRLATRRIGRGRADHGAQFFTVRSDRFAATVDDWKAVDLAYVWARGWSRGSTDPSPADGHPRYAIRGGMNALAKHLAQGLDVRVGVRVNSLAIRDGGWEVRWGEDQRQRASGVILTAPAPQSRQLLDAGGVSLESSVVSALERVEYAPCLAGLFVVQGAIDLPEPGALQQPDDPFPWIADNRRKGISPDETVVTVHAGPELSDSLFDLPPDECLQHIRREALEPRLTSGSRVVDGQLKKWRYATPLVLHDEHSLVVTSNPPLVCAGDGFGTARVEGACLSGWDAAGRLEELLGT